MSEPLVQRDRGSTTVPVDEHRRVEAAAVATAAPSSAARLLASPALRSLGLVIALALLVAVGVGTAGERFASVDNLLTVLRLASVIGVVSIGMTFVITGGGIDLSVGAIVALASVWATTLATQSLAADLHWVVMVVTAVLVGGACGLINGLLVAYGRLAPFITTLAMLAGARGLAEIIAQRRSQRVTQPGFVQFFGGDVLGVPMLVVVFALVAAAGWVLLNRTTYGRRTLAVGGNLEAARLAGIKVQRHIASLYVLLGLLCGVAAEELDEAGLRHALAAPLRDDLGESAGAGQHREGGDERRKPPVGDEQAVDQSAAGADEQGGADHDDPVQVGGQ